MGVGSLQPAAGTMLRMKHTAANGAFLVASAAPGSSPAEAAGDAYRQIGDALREKGLEIVQERVFGSLSAEAAVRAARCEALRSRGLPCDGALSYIQGRPVGGDGFAGTIVRAVPADPSYGGVQTVFENGAPHGRIWRAGGLTYILLQGLRGLTGWGEDPAPAAQARRVMERADALLRQNGADYGHTVRTWFYLSNILDWYAEFNQARSAMYRQFGLLPAPGERRILPASTGIRADLPDGAACSLDLLAVIAPESGAPESGPPAVRSLRNPQQEEAFHYGSAFSRCAVVQGPGESLIEVSGTAAIDERGESLYRGNLRAQVRCTLDKVAALIGQAGASLQDIRAATLFVKHGQDAEAVYAELAAAGLEDLPAVCVVADVCREELLFEIDAEAVVPRA